MKNKNKNSKLDSAKKEKIITFIIYAVVIIAVVTYIIITAIPKDKSNTDTSSSQEQTSSSENTSSDLNIEFVSIPEYNSEPTESGESNNTSNADISLPTTTPGEKYDIADNSVILHAGRDKYGNTLNAFYIYTPAGYVSQSYINSVMMKPEDFDTTIDKNNEIILTWGSVHNFQKLKEEYLIRDEYGTVERVLAMYDYIAHENAALKVYLIEITDSDKNASKEYIITVDFQYNQAQPYIRINERDLRNYLTTRYPSLLDLTLAIFKPVDPDKIIKVDSIPDINNPETIPDPEKFESSNENSDTSENNQNNSEPIFSVHIESESTPESESKSESESTTTS